MKTISYLSTLFLCLIACNIMAQVFYTDEYPLTNVNPSIIEHIISQRSDLDLYPVDSLKNKGVLINLTIETDGIKDEEPWWLSAGDFSINAAFPNDNQNFILNFNKDYPHGYSLVTRDYILNIPVDPIRVCGQDEEYYHICYYYPKHIAMVLNELYYPLGQSFLRVRKSEMDSLGFYYISCEKLVELYNQRKDLVHFSVGASIFPPIQLVTPEPAKDNSGNHYSPYPYYSFFVLRNDPDIKSPFINIIEPISNRAIPCFTHPFELIRTKVISKDENYWYKLNMRASFLYGGINWIAGYTGDIYTGYWQAPYDESRFPYLLVDMVKESGWIKIITILKEKEFAE